MRNTIIRKATIGLALIMAIARPVYSQQPGVYEIDSSKSRIEIHLFRTGLLGGFGDNHQILLTRFSGKAESSADRSWSVQVTGEPASRASQDRLNPLERSEGNRR